MRWVIAEPAAIVPKDATTADDLLIVDALFDSLTAWDDELEVQPGAAVRWEARRGGRMWRFFLRPGAVFHDGSPVTAGSFVAAWSQMARDGAAHHHLRDIVGYEDARQGREGPLRGVRAVDDLTLDIELGAPNWELPAIVAHPALGPVPPPAADDPDYPDQPIGNGTFRMAEPWARGRFVRVTRSETAGRPAGRGRLLDEIIFRIQDPAGGYIAYEQGRADVTTVPAGAFSFGEARDHRTAVYRGPGLLRGRMAATYFLTFNTRRPPFDDVAVRQAFSQALDRRTIVAEVFEGNAGLGLSAVPPMIPGAARPGCMACISSPETARATLRDRGVGRIDLWINEEGGHEPLARQVRDDLAAVGVRARIRALPFDDYLRALRRGRPGLFRFGWALDYPTIDNALRPMFHSSSTPASGGVNYGRYSDAEVDRLLDEARATRDAEARRALQRSAEELVINRDHAVIPVVVLRRRTLVADRVRGLVYGPLGTADLSAVRVVEPVDGD